MKKKIRLFAIPLGISILIYVLLRLIVFPVVTDYANAQLKEISRLNKFVEIQFERIDLEVLNPGIIVKNITIKTKENLSPILKDFNVDELTLRVNMFDLLLGKLNFNILAVDELKLDVNIDTLLEQPKSKSEFRISQLYDMLNMIPIQRFKIDNLSLDISSLKYKMKYRINESFIRTSYLDSKFLVRIGVKNSVIKSDAEDSSFPIEFNGNILLSKNNLIIREIFFKIKENSMRIEGLVDDVNQWNRAVSGKMSVASSTNLSDVKLFLDKFGIVHLKEKLEGKITLDGALSFKGIHSVDGNIDVNSENIVFDTFEFGTAIIKSEFKKDRVSFSNVELIHPAGKVNLSDSVISLKEPHEFKSKISSDGFDLQKLFLSLNLKEIPVFTKLSSSIQCQGSIQKFNLLCAVDAKGPNFKVLSEMHNPKARIVEINDFSMNGEIFADVSKLTYKGTLNVGDSVAESEGAIEFAKGFEVKFKTPKVDFKNIVSLANLDFKGALELEGATHGDSHSADFSMNVMGTDFSLEKYHFGTLETKLSYDDGVLSLGDMKGAVGQSHYVGNLDIDLVQSKIRGAIDFDSAKLKDILAITHDIVPIPFLIDGTGGAHVRLDGPLDFWKMNYTMNAKFKDMIVHTESFSDFRLNLTASKGTAVFSDSFLLKRNSRISIEGALNSDKTFNLNGTGQRFKLEESEFVKSIGVPIYGDLNFIYTTKGPIDDPKLSVQIESPEALIGEKQLESSEIALNLTKAAMDWDMRLFNQKLNAVVRWPLAATNSKVILNSQFNNFDYTVLFPFIGAESIQDDYLGNLTGQTTLSASNTSMTDLDGRVSIDDLKIQRGGLRLSLEEKGSIVCKKGEFTISELKLVGPDNIVEISGNDFTWDRLNVKLNAKSDLRILHFLVPFLEEVSGPFELGARVSGSMNAPRILGQALVQDSYVKIKNFPHPFEKINTTLVFSQSKIFVQNLQSSFAGGSVKSDGQIEIVGPRDIPVFLNIEADNVSLNIPDKVRTSGNANLVMSGKWFPFQIAGTYNVSGGIFEKEIGGEDGGPIVKQSIYLPKALKEKAFDPLALDINIFLDTKYKVKNSQIDGYANGNIQLKGPISNILIFGKVELEKGTKLYFKDKIFDLQGGLLNFSNPNEINPDLYITAKSRVNDYDINILLQGPAKTATIKMTSSPPLAENEIISLLALGITSSQLNQNVQSRDQAAQTGFEIGAAVLSQTSLTRNLKDRLGVDIQFVNQYDATRNASVMKATATKKITNKIQVTAARALGSEATTEVKGQYFFNSNVSAIGSWEGRENETFDTNERQQSVFGLDLEFKRDFR